MHVALVTSCLGGGGDKGEHARAVVAGDPGGGYRGEAHWAQIPPGGAGPNRGPLGRHLFTYKLQAHDARQRRGGGSRRCEDRVRPGSGAEAILPARGARLTPAHH